MNIRNKIIKFLGGYLKDEVEKIKNYSEFFDSDILEKAELNTKYNGTQKALMRATGIKFVLNEKIPPIIINISTRNGLCFLDNEKFIEIVAETISNPLKSKYIEKELNDILSWDRSQIGK